MNDPEQPMIDAINAKIKEDNQRCLKIIHDWNLVDGFNQCRFQREPGRNTIAVIGDSHAQHLYAGLITHSKENDGIAVFTAPSAIPLIGLHSDGSPARLKVRPNRAHTEHLLSEGFNYILSHRNITKVVLSHTPVASWHNVVDTHNPDNKDFDSIIRDGFVRTFDVLAKAGKEVYVVLDNPMYKPGSWVKCSSSAVRRPIAIPLYLSSRNAKACSIKTSERSDNVQIGYWNKVAHELASGYTNIHFIDLADVFCKNGKCSMLDGKANLLYMDDGHLNIKGSIYAAPFILNKLRE